MDFSATMPILHQRKHISVPSEMIASVFTVLSISTPFQSHFLLFSYSIILVLAYPRPVLSFLYSSALTESGFACHVTLVTDCVMDGILVRALLCLRHTAGQKHPATSHSTCHAPHPAHVTLYYLDFLLPLLLSQSNLAPASPSIFWHYLSFRRVSVCCRRSIIVLYFAL